jgi:hypothetical protein
MDIVNRLKGLLSWREPNRGRTELLYIYLPLAIEPDERESLYEAAIDAEVKLHRLGFVSGGGTMLSAEKDDGSCDILFCGVDVDTHDLDSARALLRDFLPGLGCPAGTKLQFGDDPDYFEDVFDGETWALHLPMPQADPEP